MVAVSRPQSRIVVQRGVRLPVVRQSNTGKVNVHTTRTVVNGTGGLDASNPGDGLVIIGTEIRIDIDSLSSG